MVYLGLVFVSSGRSFLERVLDSRVLLLMIAGGIYIRSLQGGGFEVLWGYVDIMGADDIAFEELFSINKSSCLPRFQMKGGMRYRLDDLLTTS